MLKCVLSLEACKFYLRRGAYYFEKSFGQHYDLNITFYVKCEYGKFLDYSSLYAFVFKFVNSLRFEYIEELCYLLSAALLNKFSVLACVEACVLKPLALVGGRLKTVQVLMRLCK
ncbi:MAG: dihydroneopterin aldolase [Candidatus Hodgkinia cicadicola]